MQDTNLKDSLIKDSSWTIHENNIHALLIETGFNNWCMSCTYIHLHFLAYT